jgi:hypothetical protein
MMGPVTFTFATASVAAGATYAPLSGPPPWQYQYPDVDCLVELIVDAVATGMVVSLYSGGDTIQQESPVSGGGTIAVIPNVLNGTVVTGRAAKGKLLSVNFRNTTGGAIAGVSGKITLVPVRGGRR